MRLPMVKARSHQRHKNKSIENMELVLSVFSGIDLLGKGFEQNGFCVVSSGDILYGHDIRDKRFPSGRFDGVIGGSPCQDFSKARRTPPTGYGLEMLGEFKRVVIETLPKWFLLENVPTVPNIEIEGYHIQRFDLNARECGSVQNRLRHFQFGSIEGLVLNVKRDSALSRGVPCVTASEGKRQDRRSWGEFCELQGLPKTFDLPSFTQSAKYQAVGNGVNIEVAKRVASAIRELSSVNEGRHVTDVRLCGCGCGRILEGKQKTANDACRKRLQKKRERVDVL
jgi:DNA (cytosine-5)-methyltransferase 1